mmetsp:Transcript_6473/g.16584  ORF Transcript_6473/g.16584 Transcript_6473/m.16584 type:complete len:98 (+) Transcript_6473:149-442(+)
MPPPPTLVPSGSVVALPMVAAESNVHVAMGLPGLLACPKSDGAVRANRRSGTGGHIENPVVSQLEQQSGRRFTVPSQPPRAAPVTQIAAILQAALKR